MLREQEMKRKMFITGFSATALLVLFGLSSTSSAAETQNMYRLYNVDSGEHFYTASFDERKSLIQSGWRNEGIGWVAPSKSNVPVYRLYNPNAGDHHYTMNVAEKDALVLKHGWKDEGIGWYSDSNKTVPLFRAYNPNNDSSGVGHHNYTTYQEEQDLLTTIGWKDEGIAWYGVETGKDDYFIGIVGYPQLDSRDPIQKAAQDLGCYIDDDGQTLNFYPVLSGMIQTIDGYYQGFVDNIDGIKELVRSTSQYTLGKPITLYNDSINNPEKILTAKDGKVIFFKAR